MALIQDFDTIIVGTGFAATFFLSAYLKKAKPTAHILVLERGQRDDHAWQIAHKSYSSTPPEPTFVNKTPKKRWYYTPAFGGGSNCWAGAALRMMPNDFKLKSVYGVGLDWPLSYDDLEEYYYQAEVMMAVSGPSDGSPYPRRHPYPQPPHRFNDPDKLLKAVYPTLFYNQPTARPRVATANRPACCASGSCDLCPINAKFTVLNEMSALYEDPRITLILGATVQTVETTGGVATGITYLQENTLQQAKADLIVLGANALFNPHILLRSNLSHSWLGKGLHEQVALGVNVDLIGVDNYQGSTSVTGVGYMLYDGEHRSQYAACLLETFNTPYIRLERGKWRQWLILKLTFEDLPSEQNYVTINAADPTLPETVYIGHSDYTQRAIDKLPEVLPELLAPLPVERININQEVDNTVFHIQGTTRMGQDPEQSVVDRYLVHHQLRNLVVLGSSVFPTGAPAHPTLTLSALSLWSAAHLLN